MSDNIICPYCDNEIEDSWEYYEYSGEEFECDECGETFIVTANHSVDFDCEKQKCDDKEPAQEHDYVFESLYHKNRTYVGKGEYVPCESEYFKIMRCSKCDDPDYIKLTKEEYDALKIK